MSSIIGAVAKLPVAKIIDIWGRAEGYIMMVTLSTLGEHHTSFSTPYTPLYGKVAKFFLGLIMMAACKNVETYAAAQVSWNCRSSNPPMEAES